MVNRILLCFALGLLALSCSKASDRREQTLKDLSRSRDEFNDSQYGREEVIPGINRALERLKDGDESSFIVHAGIYFRDDMVGVANVCVFDIKGDAATVVLRDKKGNSYTYRFNADEREINRQGPTEVPVYMFPIRNPKRAEDAAFVMTVDQVKQLEGIELHDEKGKVLDKRKLWVQNKNGEAE